MRPIRDIDLMLLADRELAELDEATLAELEAARASDPDAAAKLEALGHLREAVRGHLELAADAAEPRLARLWDELDKRFELDAAAVAPAAPAPAPVGLWGRFTGWLDGHRGHVLTGALSAGAVAALALVLRPVADTPRPLPGGGAGPAIDVVPAALPPEIESMEVTGGSGTVFTIEGDDGEQTTVIWVTPEDTLEGL